VTPEQIDRCINRISWGKDFVVAKDSSGRERTLIVGALSLRSKNFVNFEYDRAFKEAVDAGILTEAEILKEVGEKGIWTKDDDIRLEALHQELKNIGQTVVENATARELRKVEKLKSSIERHIVEMTNRRAGLVSNSAERYAQDAKTRAIIWAASLDANDQPLWPTYEAFCDDSDVALVDSLARQISDVVHLDTKQIRAVARSGLWRFKWSGAKAVGDLFGKPIVDLTDEQASLVYWSQVYDSVYESYERPPQSIIDDDDKLDAWLENQTKKLQDKIKHDTKTPFGVSKSVARHGEVFVMANKDNYVKSGMAEEVEVPEVGEIYDFNSELSKRFIKHQETKIKRYGVIEETDLRNDPDSRRAIGSNDAIISKRRDTDGYTKRHVDKLLPGGTIQGHKG
jgi:hypothetical protein